LRQAWCYYSAIGLALRAAVDKVSGVQRGPKSALVGAMRLIALRFLASRKAGERPFDACVERHYTK
jgi:hypothetical protein